MTQRIDLAQLRRVLTDHFNESELRILCVDLAIDFESLGGRGKVENAAELILYAQRYNRMDDLVAYVRRTRSFVKFDTASTELSPEQEAKWQADLEKYYASLKQRVGFVRILGRNKAEPLENVFTYVNVLDRLTAEQRYDVKKLIEEFDPRDYERFGHMDRMAGDEVVDEYSRLFILGKPGAGKTTFMKHTALRAIKGEINKVPIFVTLKELSDSGKELLSFMVHQFQVHQFSQAEPFVQRVLNNGDALVLFDGLDEVNLEDNKRVNLIQALNDFVYRYSDCPVLITCRVAATDYSFTQFEYVEMADFDDAQIGRYIDHWFVHDEVKRGNCRKALLETEENKAVRELAQVPLLLALLCLVFEERNEFPPEHHEIYEEATRALLSKWDASRNISRDRIYQQLSLRRKQKMLAAIATQTFTDGNYFWREQDVTHQIETYLKGVPGLEEPDAEQVLKTMEAQHGIFVERARNIHSFSHLTLQEYFTARYIVDNERRGSVEHLMRFVGDDRWQEVFLLTAGMLDNATEFSEFYLQVVARLIIDDTLLIKLLNWAVQKELHLMLPYRAASVRSFLISRGFNLGFPLALAIDPTLGRDLPFIWSLALAVELALDPVRASEYARAITHILNFASKLHLNEMFTAVQSINIPSEDANDQAWKAFSEKLNIVLETYRDQWDISRKFPVDDEEVAEWAELSEEQFELLTRYLEANRLLVRCLQVAYVPDREAILDQILLPPSS